MWIPYHTIFQARWFVQKLFGGLKYSEKSLNIKRTQNLGYSPIAVYTKTFSNFKQTQTTLNLQSTFSNVYRKLTKMFCSTKFIFLRSDFESFLFKNILIEILSENYL